MHKSALLSLNSILKMRFPSFASTPRSGVEALQNCVAVREASSPLRKAMGKEHVRQRKNR